jgi:hypothetical protein
MPLVADVASWSLDAELAFIPLRHLRHAAEPPDTGLETQTRERAWDWLG